MAAVHFRTLINDSHRGVGNLVLDTLRGENTKGFGNDEMNV